VKEVNGNLVVRVTGPFPFTDLFYDSLLFHIRHALFLASSSFPSEAVSRVTAVFATFHPSFQHAELNHFTSLRLLEGDQSQGRFHRFTKDPRRRK
jgi:hypothetical protein